MYRKTIEFTGSIPPLYCLIGVTRHASYNTKYRDGAGETQSVKKDMTGLSNVVSSTYSQQFAKTLFCVGDEMAGAFQVWNVP